MHTRSLPQVVDTRALSERVSRLTGRLSGLSHMASPVSSRVDLARASSLSQTFGVVDHRNRRVRITGNDARKVAVWGPEDSEDVLR